ncbi:hypothetical protein K0T92_22810 [Paenibacillus oenotherae]|uniref:J domain-containing protein n=1 Tax=Paenibacillus oenotherae TaxID=1435645 RepID=A0ABS7DC90_9BACL|nr:J domain-containing protein [Paenibacillus oenotherae]MBW7477554.1 hypothetical protein [Paenibacillus oenotherae]
MRAWDYLGIKPTDDTAAIKRAYAKMLKLHHPEDDPAGYQRLREAYDQVMKGVKVKAQKERSSASRRLLDEDDLISVESSAKGPDEEIQQPASYTYRIIESVNRRSAMEHEAHSEQEEDARSASGGGLDGFMEKVKSVYSDFPARLDPYQWSELLNDDLVWNASLQQEVSERLLSFLEEHYFLPKAVWTLLDETYHWKERAKEETAHFLAEYPQVYACIACNGHNMKYDYLRSGGNIDYEAYLRQREAAYRALKDGDLQAMKGALDQAFAIFEGDGELVRLQLEYYRRLGDAEAAIANCNLSVLEVYHYDEACYYRARLLYESGQWLEALPVIEELLARLPNDIDVLDLAGQCCRSLQKQQQAQEMFDRILALNENDIGAFLSQVQMNNYEGAHHSQQEAIRQKRERNLRLRRMLVMGRKAFLQLLLRKWLSFAVIIVILVLLNSPRSPLAFPAETEIRTIDDYYNIIAYLQSEPLIRVTLRDVEWTTLKQTDRQVYFKDGNMFESPSDQEPRPNEGYICVGYLDGVGIMFNASSELVEGIKGLHRYSLEVTGTVREFLPTVIWELESSDTTLSGMYAQDHGEFFATDAFIDSSEAGKSRGFLSFVQFILIVAVLVLIFMILRKLLFLWSRLRWS